MLTGAILIPYDPIYIMQKNILGQIGKVNCFQRLDSFNSIFMSLLSYGASGLSISLNPNLLYKMN